MTYFKVWAYVEVDATNEDEAFELAESFTADANDNGFEAQLYLDEGTIAEEIGNDD